MDEEEEEEQGGRFRSRLRLGGFLFLRYRIPGVERYRRRRRSRAELTI